MSAPLNLSESFLIMSRSASVSCCCSSCCPSSSSTAPSATASSPEEAELDEENRTKREEDRDEETKTEEEEEVEEEEVQGGNCRGAAEEVARRVALRCRNDRRASGRRSWLNAAMKERSRGKKKKGTNHGEKEKAAYYNDYVM
jgi:hypothetical protein